MTEKGKHGSICCVQKWGGGAVKSPPPKIKPFRYFHSSVRLCVVDEYILSLGMNGGFLDISQPKCLTPHHCDIKKNPTCMYFEGKKLQEL